MFYFQLIQRLYNLEKGDMRIENANIDAVNVPWLRSKLGLVSQVNTYLVFLQNILILLVWMF